MNTLESGFIHPEVLKEVSAEFKRLQERHPTLDNQALWAMSRDYVFTMALADTAILRLQMVI